MTTVLVVEDESLVAEVITLALEDMGLTVNRAENGRAALESIENEMPALIISDFMMPAMNGLELAAALKRNPKWSQLPIILMSGGHVDQAKRDAHLFASILQKPLSLEGLEEAVSTLIELD